MAKYRVPAIDGKLLVDVPRAYITGWSIHPTFVVITYKWDLSEDVHEEL